MLRRFSALIAFAIAAGCKDGTAPPTPASIQVASTAPTATAGFPLATPPTFSVKDAGGNLLGGVAVTIAVTAGGGTLADMPSSTTGGVPTPIGTWTLGRTAGVNTVTVTVGNLPALVITVVGVAGPPASVALVAGNGQSALAGSTLPSPLTAQVRDQFGNGVSGSVVTFQITAGGGAITPAAVTTDVTGNAGGAIWRLGRSAVEQLASATSATFSTVATATVQSGYDIDLRFFGPSAPDEAATAFSGAAARIRASVIGDLADVNIPALTAGAGIDLTACNVAGVNLNELVDDVVIYATVTSIDGPGKILASAGPCFVRLASGTDCVPTRAQCNSFPIVGVMRFDVADIAGLITTGRLNDVILHEMMHVVGVGTNWSGKSLLVGRGSGNPRFVGTLGLSGCTDAGGLIPCTGGIPVEDTGGAGTADSHWRETTFDSELMTGFVEAPGIPTPLSNMTLQSLADEGYSVNPGASDPYAVPTASAIHGSLGRASIMADDGSQWEILVEPLFGISRALGIRQLRPLPEALE